MLLLDLDSCCMAPLEMNRQMSPTVSVSICKITAAIRKI
jgi:hypothetical protein